MYKLKEKEPDFQCCDGPFEGRKFVSGKVYEKIPPEEANKFELVAEESTQVAQQTQSTRKLKSTEVTDA